MRGTRPRMTTERHVARKSAGSGLSRQRGLGLLDDCGERGRLVDREIREHLAVDLKTRLGEPVDKLRVVEADRPHGGVQALDPQRAEGALATLAVAEGVLVRLL